MVGRPPGRMVPFIVPNECLLDYILIFPPDDDPEAVKQEIIGYLDLVFNQDPWLKTHRPTLEWVHHWPAYDTPTDHPICQAVDRAHAQVLGKPAIFQGFPAVDDATYLERGGIPSVSFGPGNIMMAHAVNEYVGCDEVIDACKVYAATAIDWCGLDES